MVRFPGCAGRLRGWVRGQPADRSVNLFKEPRMELVHLLKSSQFPPQGPTKPGEVEPRYIFPLFDKLTPWLPFFIRKHFYCGFEFHKEKDEDAEEIALRKLESPKAKTNRVEPEDFDMHSLDIVPSDSKFVFGSVGKPSQLTDPVTTSDQTNKAFEPDVEI